MYAEGPKASVPTVTERRHEGMPCLFRYRDGPIGRPGACLFRVHRPRLSIPRVLTFDVQVAGTLQLELVSLTLNPGGTLYKRQSLYVYADRSGSHEALALSKDSFPASHGESTESGVSTALKRTQTDGFFQDGKAKPFALSSTVQVKYPWQVPKSGRYRNRNSRSPRNKNRLGRRVFPSRNN